jgi:hypothetical protein
MFVKDQTSGAALAQAVQCLTTGWFDPRQGQRIFLLVPASRLALGPTQPPIHWVPGVLSPGVKRGRGVTLITHPHLLPRLSMNSLAQLYELHKSTSTI